MKFISVKLLLQGAVAVVKRFPLEVLFALIGTVAAIVKIELNNINTVAESWCWRVLMMANLGFLLSLSATLYSESKLLRMQQTSLLKFVAVALAVILLLELDPNARSADNIRFFLLSLAFHLLVSYAAFTQKGAIQGFWQFNKNLFLRFFTSALYSAVLFAGLSAAIGALNLLFSFEFESDTFAILWVWIAGMFNTLFFLAGVPANYSSLNTDSTYPKGLKIFTQFVLVPLATVYVVILLAYEAKITLQWSLPKGFVSSIILGYAVFGILALLLVYPIRDQQDNKWIKTYARSFYFLLLPLLVLLFTAVGVRVFRYGITEYRYFLIALAFWLLFVSLYFLLSRKQNIKLIPVTLCILTLLTIYGPQSAFNISLYAQRQILENVFKRNQAYQNGVLLPVDSNRISKKDGSEAVAQLNYLIKRHGLSSLQPYFKRNLEQVNDSLRRRKSYLGSYSVTNYELLQSKMDWAKQQLHLKQFSGYWSADSLGYTVETSNTCEIRPDKENVIAVSGYDYLLKITDKNLAAPESYLKLNEGRVSQVWKDNNTLIIKIGRQEAAFDMQTILNNLLNKKDFNTHQNAREPTGYSTLYLLPADQMAVTKTVNKHRVTLVIEFMSYQKEVKDGRGTFNYMNGSLLIK